MIMVYQKMHVCLLVPVTLNATNYYNFTDGLAVSGILTGKGHGVSNIKAVNLRLNAIQNNELADFSVNKSHIVDDAITIQRFS